MDSRRRLDFMEEVAEHLSTKEVLSTVYRQGVEGMPLPSTETLAYLVEKLRIVLFPGYFGAPGIKATFKF